MASDAIGGGQNLGDFNNALSDFQGDFNGFKNSFAIFSNKLNAVKRDIAALYTSVKANLNDYAQERADAVVAELPADDEDQAEAKTAPKPDTELQHRQQMIYNAALNGNLKGLFLQQRHLSEAAKSRSEFRQYRAAFNVKVREYARETVKQAAVGTAAITLRAGSAPLRWTGRKIAETETYKDTKNAAKKLYRKQVLVRYAQVRRKFREEKKKRGGDLGLSQFAAKYIFAGIKNAIIDTAKTVVKFGSAVGNATRVRILNTRVGQTVVNSQTAKNIITAADEIRNSDIVVAGTNRLRNGVRFAYDNGGRLVRGGIGVIESTAEGVKDVAKVAKTAAVFTGKAALTTYKVGSATARALPKGFIVGAAIGLTTQSLPIAIGVAATATAVGTLKNLNPSRFFNADGTLVSYTNPGEELKQLAKTQGNIFTGRQMAFRSLDSGFTFAAIASIAATLLGVNPILAAGAGFAAGAAGRFLIDRYVGRSMASAIASEGGNVGWLARVPAMNMMNRVMANQWLVSQLDLLKNKYGWNMGKYLQENFGFGAGSNIIVSGGNFLGAIGWFQANNAFLNSFQFMRVAASTAGAGLINRLGLSTTGSLGAAIRGATSLGGVGQLGLETLKAGGRAIINSAANFANPVSVGATVGSVLGFAVGGLLGLGTGPGAMIAAGAGAVGGAFLGAFIAGKLAATALGAAISAVPVIGWALGPLVSIATTAGFTALFQTIGQAIGGLFDNAVNRAVNNLTSGLMSTINILGALLNLGQLAVMGINADNVLPFMMALMSIMTIMSRNAERYGESVPTLKEGQGGEASAPGQAPGFASFDLSAYKVKLVGKEGSWDPKSIKTVIFALDKLGYSLDKKYPGKQIFITQGLENSYLSDTFVLLSVDPDIINRGYYQVAQVLDQTIAGKLDTSVSLKY